MKKKVIDKQIISAIAIGIGAGIVLTPITAQAAEGDDNTPDPGEGTPADSSTAAQSQEETAASQEYSEASNTAQEDIQSARESLVDASVEVNEAAAFGDANNADAYQSAGDAITASGDALLEGANDLANSENAGAAVTDLIDDAANLDTSLQTKADTAADAYTAPTNTANEAKDKADSIDVDNTSLEDAETAVTQAEALIEKAEQEKAAADSLLDEANSAATQADNALTSIETEISDNEAELTSAQKNLQAAEDALLAAKEAVDGTKPTEQDKYNLEHNLSQNIINRKTELSKMSETDAGYQEKLKELADIILDEYVLSDNDPFFSRDDYRDGKLNFEYTFSNGEMTIILPELKKGYYTSHGEMVSIDGPGVISILDTEYNEAYVSDTADENSFIEAESHDYETKVIISESSDGSKYELYEKIEGSDKPERLEGLESYSGYTGTVSSGIPVAIKVHHEAEFNKYNVTTRTITEYGIYDIENEVIYDTHNNYYYEFVNRVIAESQGTDTPLSLDTSIVDEYNKPGYTFSGSEETGYSVTIHFISKIKVGGTYTLDATKAYTATRCFYKDGYEQQTVADTTKNPIKKDLDAQLENVTKMQEREEAIEAYNTAIDRVSAAKAKVIALQEKGRVLFAQLREKASREAANNAIAHSKLELALTAQGNARTAIDNAKSALETAKEKLAQIREKSENEQAGNEGGSGSGSSSSGDTSGNGGSSGDGGSSGSGGSSGDGGTAVTPTSDTVTPASDPAPAPSVISPATPVLALGTDSQTALPSGNRTQFYKSLSEELTKQILDQRNTGRKAAGTENAIKPGDMVKDTTAGLNKPESLSRVSEKVIEDENTPLAETTHKKSPAAPFAIALLLAVAGGITIEEYYRRRNQK